MVEEPFVNLRTAIESTRQAVLLKYYNELLELDPKTQPKQITAVTTVSIRSNGTVGNRKSNKPTTTSTK